MQVRMKGKKYMKKKESKIPKFKSINKEADFWDKHEFTEFEDELKEVKVVFNLKKKRDDTLVVRLQKQLKNQMEKIARNRGLNISTLARMWLVEKLQTTI